MSGGMPGRVPPKVKKFVERNQKQLKRKQRKQQRDSTDLSYNDPMQRSKYYEDGSFGPKRKRSPDPAIRGRQRPSTMPKNQRWL